MAEENKHMDDSFKKMGDEFKVTYDKSFWTAAKAQLENESLDNAFREAAANYVPAFGSELASESLGDAFMDDAFREAAKQTSVVYDQAYWQQMESMEPNLHMDDAFFDASKGTVFNYKPAYWGDANSALEAEGLHYEYQSAYWKEAKDLLDKADRKTFFTKWSGAAALLVLISFFGIYNDIGSTNHAKVDQLKTGLIEKSGPIAASNNVVDVLQPELNENSYDVNGAAASHEQEVNNNQSLVESIDSDNSNEDIDYITHEVLTEEVDQNNTTQIHNQADDLSVAPIENEETNIDQVEFDNNIAEEEIIEPNVSLTDQSNNEIATDEIDETDEIELEIVDPIISAFNTGNNRFAQSEPEMFKKNGLARIDMKLMPMKKITFGLLAMPETALTKITPLKRHPSHTISFIGGGGFGNSFGSDDLVLTRRLYGGLEYMAQNHGKLRNFEFGASLVVNYAKHDDFGVDSIVQRFLVNGDVERYWYKLQVHDLFYANANFLVNYKLNLKNKIKFGVGVEKLIGVQSNMAVKLNDDKGIRTENNNWGVQNGIAQFDMRFSLGYEYRLTRKFGIQLNTAIGLFDRSEDQFYGNGSNIFDNEMSITLGLKYNLFTRVK